MNNNQFEIDRYLAAEMSEAEKQAFEERLAGDKILQQELQMQQQLQQAIHDAGIKGEFRKAIRKRNITRQLVRWGIVAAIIAAVIVAGIKNNWLGTKQHREANNITTPERFEINTAADTIIETKDGVVFAIPAGAFANTSGPVTLEIKTALNAKAIMQQGLSTVSNGDLLQTAGMFYINATADGQPLTLEKEIAVSVPAKEVNPRMQLFDGVADSSGQINWANPKPVEKRMRTADINRLNFYPPDYLPTLKELGKDIKNKRYTDSLYYSFSGLSDEGTTPAAAIEYISNDPVPATEGIDEGVGKPDEYFATDTSKKDTTGHVEYPVYDRAGRTADTIAYYHYEIDPARIRAIWNEKFANTIIATKAFEERLQYMHGLCNPMYLDAYLQGLNRPLYETDQLLADASYGAVKEKFLEFARRKDGKVILAEGIQQKLNTYYEEKVKAYQQAAMKTRAAYEAALLRLDSIADSRRREQAIDEFLQKESAFEEEFCANLTNAYRQIGVKRSCNDTIVPPDRPAYEFTINTLGWKNLDVYVYESTRDRQSMTYTDPSTGKTAKLEYRDFTVTVQNEETYDKVFVYLIPDSLNSFQRMKKSGTDYKEKLNTIFRYDVVVLAYKGTKAYYRRERQVSGGYYSLSAEAISQEDLQTELNRYTGSKRETLRKEIAYGFFEQEETQRQVQVQKDKDFRYQVMQAIFECIGRDGDPGTTK